MIKRGKIPNNDLSIKAASIEYIRIVRMKLDGSDLNGRLKDMTQSNNMIIREIKDQHVWLKRFTLYQGP